MATCCRVAIVAASPLVGDGLAAALAGDPRWQTAAPLPRAGMIDWRHDAPDAVVAAPADAAEAALLADACADHGTPLLLCGDALGGVAARALGGMAASGVSERRAACGVLPAATRAAQVRAALAAVLQGLHVFSVDSAREALQAACAAAPAAPVRFAAEPPGEPLTPRELEVFELVAKGFSNRDIAAALDISAHTAKFHVGQILAKIGAATRAEAVSLGLKLGLIGV